MFQPLITRVCRTIERYAMFTPGDKVLVGVSGGPDSVALLHLLHVLAPRYELQLAVAHLNHGLRPQVAEAEAAQVHHLAQSLQLSYHTKQIKLDRRKGSVEERARQVRYAFFEQVAAAQGYTKIAVGHQADDNGEALVLHLLRGSGIRGLAGIPPVRDNRIVRPLIEVQHAEILAYLKEARLPFAEDASNTDLRFMRNRVRHELIPLLQSHYNPKLVDILNRTARLCREEETWLQSLLQPLLAKTRRQTAPHCLELQAATLTGAPRPAQRRVIREALRQWRGHLQRLSADHVEMLIDLLSPDKSGRQLNLPLGVAVERTPTDLRFTYLEHPRQSSDRAAAHFFFTVPGPDTLPLVVDMPQANCRLHFTVTAPPQPGASTKTHDQIALFDLHKLAFPLHIRSFQPGDRMVPFGLHGSQKLKKLFIDRKIPRNQRGRIPLLISAGRVMWAVGVRRAAGAAVSAATSRVLKVERQDVGGALEPQIK